MRFSVINPLQGRPPADVLPAALPRASARPPAPRRAARIRGAVWLVLLVVALGLPAAARCADAREPWRAEAARIRILAENDAPRARDEALRLQAALPADAPAADRALALNVLARAELYLGRTAEAGEAARRAHDLAARHDERVGQAEADLNLALISVNEGNIDALIAATTHSLEVLEGVDRPDLLGEALLRTAMMYRRLGQIDESVALCVQAMEIARRNDNPLVLAYAHQGLGISFDLSDRHLEALEHFRQMREYARQAGFKLLAADALVSLGNATAGLGDPKRGKALIREAIADFREVGAPFNLAHGLFALAHRLQREDRHREALGLLDEITATYERHPNTIGLWFSLNARSTTHQALGHADAALTDADRGYALARAIGLPLYLSESAQRVAAVTALRGNFSRAYELLVEATGMRERAEREKTGARVIALAQRYESESKRRQIEELTRRNEIQSAELKQRALQQRWLWTVLGGSIAALAGGAFFLLRLRHSHRLLELANVQLQDSRDDVRNLNAGLEQRVYARTSELRQQTRYLRTLIDTLPWWVWLKDTESRYLAVNETAAETFHLAADELVGKSDFDVVPRERAQAFRADDVEVMQTRARKTVEETQVLGDGETIWLETFKAPVLDEDGTVLGTVGFARDISERKAAETAREAALAEAQRLARLRSEFLAQMSHELRTPLNGILGYAQILQLDRRLDARQLAGVNVIRQSGEHLLTLIDDILDLAKIEAGKLELYPGDIRLDKFLRTVAGIIGVKAERKLLAFVCDFAPELPACIRADEKRLRQVLLNLLANAVSFTERGRVILRVRFAPPGRLRFEVEDAGIGIDPAHHETIFQPFEQAGELPQRIGGAGLGLAISRQFVRLMGGDIAVDSRPGEGSIFAFELEVPVVATSPDAAPDELVVIGYEGPRRSILVVDDLAANRAVLADMLAPLGFEVIEAASGPEGIERAAAVRPALILMDVVMAGTDGLEATRRLRRMAAQADVPVIAVSASTSASDEDRCLAAGIDAFLPKPIDRSALLARIADLLDVRWIHAETDAAEASPAACAAPLVAPPGRELAHLHRLALQGDMRDIAQEAARIAALDARYRGFADRIRRLAEDYQSQALLRVIERHLDGM